MAEFVIETGIEMSSPGSSYYPFSEMAIGDSFFAELRNGESKVARQHQIAGAAYRWGKDHNVKFATRQMDGGVRVWRTE